MLSPSRPLKRYLNFLCIFTFFFLVESPRSSYNKVNYFIIWNTGYGEWSTWIKSNECIHYGVGSERFMFKAKYLESCLNRKNKIQLLQIDRFHLSLSYHFKKYLTPNCQDLYQLRFKDNKFLFKNAHRRFLNPNCQISHHNEVCLPFGVYMSKHPKKNKKTDRDFQHKFRHCQRLAILPGHGSYKYYNKNKAKKWLKFYMLVSSTKYRQEIEDSKTKKKFKTFERKIIYTHKWGHLIFQVPEFH